MERNYYEVFVSSYGNGGNPLSGCAYTYRAGHGDEKEMLALYDSIKLIPWLDISKTLVKNEKEVIKRDKA